MGGGWFQLVTGHRHTRLVLLSSRHSMYVRMRAPVRHPHTDSGIIRLLFCTCTFLHNVLCTLNVVLGAQYYTKFQLLYTHTPMQIFSAYKTCAIGITDAFVFVTDHGSLLEKESEIMSMLHAKPIHQINNWVMRSRA